MNFSQKQQQHFFGSTGQAFSSFMEVPSFASEPPQHTPTTSNDIPASPAMDAFAFTSAVPYPDVVFNPSFNPQSFVQIPLDSPRHSTSSSSNRAPSFPQQTQYPNHHHSPPSMAVAPPTPPNQSSSPHSAANLPISNGESFANNSVVSLVSSHLTSPEGIEEPILKESNSPNERPNRPARSDDDDANLAQTRRKAQNRAAQRAFRERKERHVKELEAKLDSLEAAQQKAMSENERLKLDLQKAHAENEVLRATSALHAAASPPYLSSPSPSSSNTATVTHADIGPMTYKPTDFYSSLLAPHANKTPSHRIVTSDDGQRLLAAGATWDLIVSHSLYAQGCVDVAQVSELLKHKAKCDGQGPVFAERDILEAIEKSAPNGEDGLL